MTPAARVQAAIEVVGLWLDGDEGVDRVLSGWARAHRFAGSGDRRAIADLVYDALRRRRSAGWVAGGEDARALLRGSLMLDGLDPAEVFTGERHTPAALAPVEAGPPRPLDTAPEGVRLDCPDWLLDPRQGVLAGALAALRTRAPVDLRVNTLKATREDAREALAAESIETVPLPLAPTALRVTEGARRVAGSAAYRDGLVEIQDAASQAVAAFAGAQPGMTVLDLCAGGGGKTLALGAAMAGEGRLIAHDIAPARMKDLGPRARRAGVAVETVGSGALPALDGACDRVVVDAPCSGSGAWRRNPDAKWRLTPERLETLRGIQADLLDQAADLCAPGGEIIYMTCSILGAENAAQVKAYLARAPGWECPERLSLTPADGGDGFFAARLRRRGEPSSSGR